MELPRSSSLVARLDVVPHAGSTNTELVRAAAEDPGAWPAPAVLVTDHQTAGRGRLGRSWSARAGDSLAISVLLRPAVPRERLGWLSLAAGAAMTQALEGLGVAARAKWPNDVLIGDRKVCGVLAEALVDGGVRDRGGPEPRGAPGTRCRCRPRRRWRRRAGRPTRTCSSPRTSSASSPSSPPSRRAGGDPEASGVRAAVLAASGTLGRRVRVDAAGGPVVGTAVDIDAAGRIVVDRGPTGGRTACATGDVEHLRYE